MGACRRRVALAGLLLAASWICAAGLLAFAQRIAELRRDVGGGDPVLEALRLRGGARSGTAAGPPTATSAPRQRPALERLPASTSRTLTWPRVRDTSDSVSIAARSRGARAALVAAAGAIAAIALALGFGDREPLELRVDADRQRTRTPPPRRRPTRSPGSADAPRGVRGRAALGASHVIYELSPAASSPRRSGPSASATQIEAAAERHGVDPDTLEAIIFLESAGRPDVIAGPTPESASGLAQILPSTATDLLGMKVDLRAEHRADEGGSRAPKIAGRDRAAPGRSGRAIDQRFDPEARDRRAPRPTSRSPASASATADLAIASYHMGIGNLESVLRAYAHAPTTCRSATWSRRPALLRRSSTSTPAAPPTARPRSC